MEAGSAGCVLAARLSEDPAAEVVLIEAGPPDKAQEIHIPAAWPQLFKSRYDWDYASEREPWLDRRRVYLPRGKMLGGLEFDKRDGLHPGRPRRLRRLGEGWREGVGL